MTTAVLYIETVKLVESVVIKYVCTVTVHKQSLCWPNFNYENI